MPALAEASVARDLASFDSARHQLLALRTSRPNGLQDVDYWEPLATIPAAFLDGYAYTASTSQDSLPGSNPYTAFFIQALTSNFAVFYSSQVDSGYSVDNLAPASPAPFVAVYSASGVALHWGPNREADLYGYRLHRGTRSDFVPGPGNLVASLSDTGYVDHPPGCAATYKLCAVDIHGNASLYALVSVTGPTAVLASLVSADVEDGVVRLRWSAPANPGLAATVYRDEGDGRWQSLCTIVADGTGLMRYDDASVTPGARYGYRLGILNGDQEVYVGEVLVTVPVLALALRGVRPNPALNDLTVAFSLPDASPARIEVLDLAGRRVLVREVGTLGAGHHTLNLTNSQRLPAGIYLIRLASGGRSLVARATVVR